MHIATMAASGLRPMYAAERLEDFMAARGGNLGGTFHCGVYMGTRVLWDARTDECFTAEGVVETAAGHLKPQLRLIAERIAVETGTLPSMDGILVRVKDSLCQYRILDMVAPLPVWRQVNLLADAAALLEPQLPHVRPAQHFHTPVLKTEKQIARWLKSWKRPGLSGVLVKDAEMLYAAGEHSRGCCLIPL